MSKSAWMLSVALCALAAPAFAQGTAPQEQPQDQAEITGTGDIIVTATRRASPLSDVPIAVSAVTAATLQNSGGTDIRSLNQLAPSLLVSSTGTEANGSARIRGIGTVGDNPGLESSVAVFVDGVYRSRTGVGLNELGEVERVEVLRGPQGTLFGRNASAGLINIVSKKPAFEFGGNVEGTYGNYNFYRLAGSVTGPIAETVAFRLDGVYVKRDGFYKNMTQGGGSESDVNDRDRFFVRGQLLFEPTSDLNIRLIGDYTRRNESCCAAVYVATKETIDATRTGEAANTNPDGNVTLSATNRIVDIMRSMGGLVSYPPSNPYSREIGLTPGRTYRNITEDYGASGEINYSFGNATLTSITAYRYYKAGGAADIDYGNLDISYRAGDGNSYRQFKTFTQELRLQGSVLDDRVDWLIGGYYANEKLQLSDNARFGAQYGAFAACRTVATINGAAVLRDPTASGCLSAAGRATLTPAIGATLIAGIDRLSTLNNLGSSRDIYNQKSENYAFFTHNIVKITDRLNLTLGVRYTHETKDFNATFNNNNNVCPAQQAALATSLANPVAQLIVALTCTGNSSTQINSLALTDSFGEGQWTGTGVLSWKPTNRLMTYASYSKGYKAGGYNLDRSALGGPTGFFSPRSNADAVGLRFEPEKVDAYEIGFKYNTHTFNLNVAAFRQDFQTFQLNTFNGSIFIVQNIASCSTSLAGADRDNSLATGACTTGTKAGVRSQGIEIETALYPTRSLAITLGYTLADTKYRNDLVGSSAGAALSNALYLLPGAQMSNAPRNVVTGSFSFTPELGSSGLSGLLYVDGRLSSDYNTGSDLFPEKAQDSFAVVNARIGIRGARQRWAIEFWGQNIFNEQYQQVAFNAPFQGSGSIAQTLSFGTTSNQLFSSYLAEPRTYGITGRFKF